jgi:alkylated DNA repair dioxygenase AlkB
MQPNLFDSGGEIIGTVPPGFSYVAGFLDRAEQLALLQHVQELEYTHDTFRGQSLKRGYAQFGYAYVSTGRTLEPAAPMPDFLTALIERALPHCPDGTTFNQCIVTRYPSGAGIGWHTDAPRFGEVIVAGSLGAQARLQFRRNGTEEVVCELMAGSGSLYVMRGPARWEYQHQVVAVESVRYSLTFRSVAEG